MAPLKRHPILIPLSREHHEILVVAQLLKSDVPDYRGLPNTPQGKKEHVLQFFEDVLSAHLKCEEESLFPMIRGKDPQLDALSAELLTDHKEIRQKIKGLGDVPQLTPQLDELGHALSTHVRKEERQFFTRLQEVATEEDWAAIKQAFYR